MGQMTFPRPSDRPKKKFAACLFALKLPVAAAAAAVSSRVERVSESML